MIEPIAEIKSEELHKLVTFLDFFQKLDVIESEEEKRGILDCEEIHKFRDELSETGFLVVFDWMTWLDQNEMYKDIKNDIDEHVMKADVETLRKLLTSYIRGDRFTEGLLDGVILNGHVTKILTRLKDLLDR